MSPPKKPWPRVVSMVLRALEFIACVVVFGILIAFLADVKETTGLHTFHIPHIYGVIIAAVAGIEAILFFVPCSCGFKYWIYDMGLFILLGISTGAMWWFQVVGCTKWNIKNSADDIKASIDGSTSVCTRLKTANVFTLIAAVLFLISGILGSRFDTRGGKGTGGKPKKFKVKGRR